MSVLSRPLFRQAGGPAQPMPQDMAPPPMPPMPSPMAAEQMMANAPPPEMAMLEQAEAGATAQGQELGAAYAEQMMAGIDGAQSTEDLINALRGNDKPLDARRDELAGLVGKADANQTPESVLAMVQPVIMMTEEGMMDSGIGALVQQITGDVEMTTADGAPTEMGMGVGSLMAAGAQEAPAPQNFRQGGEVAHLQDGSNPVDTAPAMSFSPLELEKLLSGRFSALASENVMSFGDAVKGRYEDLLPLYQEILGADQESKDATKAQMLFDVAQGGLQLAAGVPGAGSSFASQLAGAAAPVAGRIQERGAALEQERRGIKQGALGTAMQQALSEEEFSKEYMLAMAKQTGKTPDLRNLVDKDGTIVGVLNLNDPDDLAAAKNAPSEGLLVQTLPTTEKPNLETIRILYNDTSTSLVTTDDNGKTFTFGDGTIMPRAELKNVQSIVSIDGREAANVQDKSARVGRFQKLFEDYQDGSYRSGASLSGITALESSATSNKELDVSSQEINRSLKYLDANGQEQVLNVIDASLKGLGPVRSLESAFRSVFGFLSDELPADAQEREQFRQYLRAVGFTGKVALISSPRFPVAEMQMAQQILADPSIAFQDPKVAAENWRVVKRVTDTLRGSYLRALADPMTDRVSSEEAMQGLARIDTLDALMGPINGLLPSLDSDERFEGTERSGSVFGG